MVSFSRERAQASGSTRERAMVKGLTEDAVKRLASLKTQIEQQSKQVNTQLEAIDAHLSFLQESANKTDKRLDAIEAQLTKTDKRLDSVETQLIEHKTLLTQILARLPERP
jgi:peptidoglycan hydrolase CwlO-like protein